MQEIIEKRTKRSKTFDLGGGKFRLETGNHSHTQKNGLWLPTDANIKAESGSDLDTGLNYIARSRFENLDYDIRFGKNDPVWMKIKHVPSGKMVTFKPKNNNNRPDHVITGNKIFVSQAWDGIDMEIFVSDNGTKTNYIITSPAGQRVIEFNVSGDLASFRVGAPWYRTEAGLVVVVPSSFASGVMSYDFRQVPVGTVVDPTVAVAGYTSDNWLEANGLKSTYSWAQTVAFASGDVGAALANTDYLSVGNQFDASYWYLRRALLAFDTSGIPASNTVSSASLRLVQYGSQSGTNILKLYIGTFALPVVGAGLNDFTTACSAEKVATLTDDIALTDLTAVIKAGTTKIMVRNHKDWTETEPTQVLTYLCRSSNSTEPTYRPTLTINYEGSSSPAKAFGADKAYPFARGRGWR